jgi:charged multivesicular body protein 4
MNLFGRPKKKAAPKIGDSIQRLREAQETLDKREVHLEKQIQGCLQEAKKKRRMNDKKGAMYHLKRKAMLQKQVDQLYGKKTNLETQIMALEAAATNREIVSAMQMGSQALAATIGDETIEKAQDVMDDIAETMGMAEELGDLLSNPMGEQMDDEDLLAELADLEEEMADEDVLALDAPAVPTTAVNIAPTPQQVTAQPTAIPANETPEEAEARQLAELEQMMF